VILQLTSPTYALPAVKNDSASRFANGATLHQADAPHLDEFTSHWLLDDDGTVIDEADVQRARLSVRVH